MKIKNLIKQITCSHNYVPWANIYGDLIEDFDGSRTVLMCTKCHKRLFINEYIDAPLNYNKILHCIQLIRDKSPENKIQYELKRAIKSYNKDKNNEGNDE